MRITDIIKSSRESEAERLTRLQLMYGAGRTQAEADRDEHFKDHAAMTLDLAKAQKAEAEAAAKFVTALMNMDEEEIHREFPWPNSGTRSLNRSERLAMWARCSRVAERPLPPFEP